jgi:hypothetical protein
MLARTESTAPAALPESQFVYVGTRDEHNTARVEVVHNRGGRVARERLPHAIVHSPSGLEWGYTGSGPADLALSMLTHHLHVDARAVESAWHRAIYPTDAVEAGTVRELLRLHQDFKLSVISGQPREGFRITTEQVAAALDYLRRQERERDERTARTLEAAHAAEGCSAPFSGPESVEHELARLTREGSSQRVEGGVQ